jgi:hypothetical protein
MTSTPVRPITPTHLADVTHVIADDDLWVRPTEAPLDGEDLYA